MEPSFNAKDQKVLVKFLHFMRNDPTEIHRLLTAACGEMNAADYKIVKGWVRELDQGNDENEDEVAPEGPNGIPVTVLPPDPTDPAMVQRVEYLITNDRRISVDRIAEMAQITKATALNCLTNVLGLKKVCERWVPRLWTPEQRAFRVVVAKELLDRYDQEGDDFLKRIIVGDETFIQYYTPDKLPTHTAPHRRLSKGIAEERYKPNVEPIACTFIFFFDCHGLLCVHQAPQGTTVNAEYYANFIRNELAPAVRRKRRGANISEYLLLHDNTPVHNALETQRVLKELKVEALPHAPASPDMEPVEYFLINYVNSHLRGTPFNNALAIGSTISHHLVTLSENNYQNAFKTLVGRWEHIIDSRGLYVL